MKKKDALFLCIAFFIPLAICGLFYYLFVNDGDDTGFATILLNYKSFNKVDYPIKGFDFSHHNGAIDWAQTKLAYDKHNIRFIIFKATEGRSMEDLHYKENYANAKAHGFICGAYHFFLPWIPSKFQAENFSSSALLKDGDLPPIVDVETESKIMSRHRYQETLLKLLQRLEDTYNVKPIIYITPKLYEKYCNSKEFAPYPVWIASYRNTLKFKDNWIFWQYTDNGTVSGVKGRVDVNVFNHKRYGSLQKIAIHK